MSQVQQLIEKVEQIAGSRPSYSLPNFLPSAVVELGVLSALEDGGMSGTRLIRELSPLSRRASGYGVHYPLLHEMEATGILIAYRTADSNQRYYSLTEVGQVQLGRLRQEYTGASAEQYQTGLQLINPLALASKRSVVAAAC